MCKWIFSGLSIAFISILFIMVTHTLLGGESTQVEQWCNRCGFLASLKC